MATTTVYAADLTKTYRNDAGDLVVEGTAASPDLDLDKQVCDPEWLKSAMPEWFEWGNIRQQHSELPAGHATDMEVLPGDKWWVKALITEPSAAHMAESGTYKGLSIGIKDPVVMRDSVAKSLGAAGGRIVGGKIVHVGMVDRPCNPVATLTLAKAAMPGITAKAADLDTARMLVKVFEPEEHPENADAPSIEDRVKALEAELAKRAFTQDQRDAAAAKGHALPDGSFPIETPQDVKNAVRDIGRTNNPAKAKAHIKKRAKALGRTDLIPEDWKALGADLTKAEGETHDANDIAAVRDGLVALIKAELDELCDGENELCDIGELLCSLQYLMCWWDHEADAGETADPYPNGDEPEVTQVLLGAQPDKETAMTGTETQTSPPATEKAVATGDLAELVKTAVAEATKSYEAQLAAVRDELAKVADAPQAGGPVLMATREGTDLATKAAAADHYLRLAEDVTDPDLRAGYRAKAEALKG